MPKTIATPKTASWNLIINGKKIAAKSGKTFPVHNPATTLQMGSVAEGGAEDVDLAIKAAQDALTGPWGKMPARERGKLMLRLSALIRENLEELAKLETANAGKPIRDSRDEVNLAADCIEYYGGAANKHFGNTIPVAAKGISMTLREPVGVCALIVPWNYPLVIATWKLGPALGCGNTVVLKPASYTPLTALRLGELALEAGFPSGVLNVITGPGRLLGNALVTHAAVKKISFTGETTTGADIMKLAAPAIKRVSLELGGKSASVIFADADLDVAAQGSVFSVFSNAGQDCCARSRIIVEEKAHDKFLELYMKKVQAIKLGDPMDEKTEVGPMISETQRQKVLGYIKIGENAGAKRVLGGKLPHTGAGYYLEPCILDKVSQDSRVFQEEIFGPVVCITTFKTEEEAVEKANATIYGLSGSIWTGNVGRAIRVAKGVKTGNISVNSSSSVHLESPFGGVGASGVGRELGMEAMNLYSEIKTLFIAQ